MRVLIHKHDRLLQLLDGSAVLLRARVALGRQPEGPKRRQGDQKTPEGVYQICLAKENGKYGLSLGLNYPNAQDARSAFAEGAIDQLTLCAVEAAVADGRRPPWGSPLGGEIHLHEGPVDTDWTAGCVALLPEDMAVLYRYRSHIEDVEIRP
jgi:murein L,D-transpeptidase YafK